MPNIYLSIGSNIDRERNIRSALAVLKDLFGELKVSDIYETEAVGFDGPPFYNLAVRFYSDKALSEIAKILKQVEIQHGRSTQSAKFSGRTLDLDILLYGELISEDDKLQVPREDILRYGFVLEPLAEIAPDNRHPVTQERFSEIWERFDKKGLKQRPVQAPW